MKAYSLTNRRVSQRAGSNDRANVCPNAQMTLLLLRPNARFSAVTAKSRILSKLRKQIVDQVELPSASGEGAWIRYDDPKSKFCEMVVTAGGQCLEVDSWEAVREKLSEFPEWQEAKHKLSLTSKVESDVDISQIEDPHDLENLDFVIQRGQLAVSENGAIWVSDAEVKHRVVYFITQFLVLVIDAADIVHNMHEGYARAKIPQPGFGLWVSGPSKTADIEQSLVIGAHGCRELTVFVIS